MDMTRGVENPLGEMRNWASGITKSRQLAVIQAAIGIRVAKMSADVSNFLRRGKTAAGFV